MADRPLPDVRVGQLWEDCDKRSYGRKLRVIQLLDNDKVLCQGSHPALYTKISRRRFRPTSNGYRLVQDVPASYTGILPRIDQSR